ncbi:MAG TPA: hypothetical protein VLM79_40745 [Kofleriaceae bacterium]|nr:hypothetical protein [Kofleriaceae bacterium]
MCSALLLYAAGDAHSDPVPVGNPYSFYGSVAECAAAERSGCDDCLAQRTCTPITDIRDGDAECTQLAHQDGRGYFLICINLALAIDAVNACTARGSPCPRDQRASESLASLEANAQFLDDPACAAPLDTCLAALYGAPAGGFPGPGAGGDSAPPRNTSVDCGDSCGGDSSCDSDTGCEIYGSCDDSDETSCSDSEDSSGCGDTSGGDAGGDSCSGDSEDACGSDDNSSCDSSDCGGGGDSDCGSSSSSGGDCGGESGGDCGGESGGDCGGSGGGGDCNVAAKHGRTGMSLPITIAWAMLPIPIAMLVRRRAERRRARARGDAQSRAEQGRDGPGDEIRASAERAMSADEICATTTDGDAGAAGEGAS